MFVHFVHDYVWVTHKPIKTAFSPAVHVAGPVNAWACPGPVYWSLIYSRVKPSWSWIWKPKVPWPWGDKGLVFIDVVWGSR